MDKVCIEGLSLQCVIGVYDWEKEHTRPLLMDLELAWDITAAARSDDLSLTLDYEAVSKRLVAFVAATTFELIESLAEACASLLMEEFSVPWLKMTLKKPGAVAEAVCVAVVIERGVKAS